MDVEDGFKTSQSLFFYRWEDLKGFERILLEKLFEKMFIEIIVTIQFKKMFNQEILHKENLGSTVQSSIKHSRAILIFFQHKKLHLTMRLDCNKL